MAVLKETFVPTHIVYMSVGKPVGLVCSLSAGQIFLDNYYW